MRILVTGASGFIGSHLCEYLSSLEGTVAVGLDRSKFPNSKGVTETILGDILDKESISSVLSKFDGVVHLAGILGTSEMMGTMREALSVNVFGALNIYETLRERDIPAVQITVGNYTWLNTYSITKYTAERIALMYNQEYGTRIAVVRGLNVYGPRQKHYPVRKVVPTFIYRALRGEDIEIFGDGNQVMDLVYVGDLCKILSRALLVPHECYDQVFEAGSGYAVRVNALAEKIRSLCNSSSDIVHLPMRPGEPVNSRTVGNPRTLFPLSLDASDFRPLEEGLKETIGWYCQNYPWKEGVGEV